MLQRPLWRKGILSTSSFSKEESSTEIQMLNYEHPCLNAASFQTLEVDSWPNFPWVSYPQISSQSLPKNANSQTNSDLPPSPDYGKSFKWPSQTAHIQLLAYINLSVKCSSHERILTMKITSTIILMLYQRDDFRYLCMENLFVKFFFSI